MLSEIRDHVVNTARCSDQAGHRAEAPRAPTGGRASEQLAGPGHNPERKEVVAEPGLITWETACAMGVPVPSDTLSAALAGAGRAWASGLGSGLSSATGPSVSSGFQSTSVPTAHLWVRTQQGLWAPHSAQGLSSCVAGGPRICFLMRGRCENTPVWPWLWCNALSFH